MFIFDRFPTDALLLFEAFTLLIFFFNAVEASFLVLSQSVHSRSLLDLECTEAVTLLILHHRSAL